MDIAAGRLSHLGVLRFAGPDAIAFLQGQVSNDTTPLAGGAPVLAAYSTVQGRVLAILHLLPHSSGVLAVLPRELAAATQERLRKFVLRAKVKIEDLSERWIVAGADSSALRTAGIDAPASTSFLEKADGLAVARVRHGPLSSCAERYWLVGEAAAFAAGADPARAERAWRLADVRDGMPQVYAATSEVFVAQMLNLDLIGGISFTKGCYTGQEIIARTQHLGRIKRRMSRLRLPPGPGPGPGPRGLGPWSIGQPLRLTDGRSGRLTEIAPVESDGGGFEALAVLSLDATAGIETSADAGSGANADGGSTDAITVAELPLPYRTG